MAIFRYILFISIVSLVCACKSNDLETARIQNSSGLKLYDKGDYKKAVYFFIKASKYENLPDTIRAIYIENIASAYARSAKLDSSEYFYRKAATLYSPLSRNYKVDMANSFLVRDSIDSALQILHDAYRIDSSNGTVNNLLGLIYLGEYGHNYLDPGQAYKYNKKAFEQFQDAPSKFALAKNEYLLNNTERAITLFSQLHIAYPRHKGYLISLILIKGEKGNEPNMDMLLRELKRKFPGSYASTVSQIAPGHHTLTWTR